MRLPKLLTGLIGLSPIYISSIPGPKLAWFEHVKYFKYLRFNSIWRILTTHCANLAGTASFDFIFTVNDRLKITCESALF